VLVGGGVASRTNGHVATPVLLPGVLQMRAGGMGWHTIATSMGVTLAQAMKGGERRADGAAPPDPRRATAARGGGSVVPVAVAGSDVPALRRPGATPAPISSASITKSSAGGPRSAPVAKPVVAVHRPARREPGPEIRRAGGSVLAAADVTVRGETVTMPAQDGARAGAAGMTPTASPAFSRELAEESPEAD
jgi:hypothetical protein